MKKIKWYIMFLFVVLALMSSFVVYWYDDDSLSSLRSALQETSSYGTHYLYIQPVTSSSGWYSLKSWFKYYCQWKVRVYVTWSTQYGTIAYNFKFDPDILHNVGWNINSSVFDSNPHSDFVSNYNNLYAQWWQSLTARVWWYLWELYFTPWTWKTEMWVDICDKEWNYCTPKANPDVNYKESYAPSAWWWILENLGVKWAIYDLYAWPCTPDTQVPIIESTMSGRVYTWSQTFTWLIYDRWNSLWDYWFSWHDYSETWVNYVLYNNSNTLKMDNQEWINSWTIEVRAIKSNWERQTLSFDKTPVWTSNRKAKTWDSHDRWYMLSIGMPNWELEKPVTIILSGCDFPNETGAIHCATKSFTLNNTTNPTIKSGYNTNGTTWRTDNVFPSSSNEYMIVVSDDPAGINSGSITITFSESTDLSGNSNPTYILSWSELSITESWVVTDYWVRTIYEVRFHPPYNLLEWTQTRMDVYVKDYVWNSTSKTFNLNTRAACSSFGGCRDYLNINHFGDIMGNEFTRLFSWLNIVVTGDINSIYPYLEWDRLYCGLPFDWAELVPQWVMNLYQYSNADVQTGLMLSTSNKYVGEAANSEDVDHDFGRDENNRNMIKDISVY